MACVCCPPPCLCDTAAAHCVYTISVAEYTKSVTCGPQFLEPPMRDQGAVGESQQVRQRLTIFESSNFTYGGYLEMGISSCPISLPFPRTSTGFASLFGCDQSADARFGVCKQTQGCDFSQDSAQDASGRFHLWSYASVANNFIGGRGIDPSQSVVHLWEVILTDGVPTVRLVWAGRTNINVTVNNAPAVGAGVDPNQRCTECNQQSLILFSNPPEFDSPLLRTAPFGTPQCPPTGHLGTPSISVACPP